MNPRENGHHLYRCYDAQGGLLYIGCTNNITRRMTAHRADSRANASRWLSVCMDRFDVEGPFADRDSALAAESAAIEAEQPLFNRQERGVPNWLTKPDVAEYLIDHGHLELALETACGCWRETREAERFDSWCVPHRALESLERA